jgi:hypothetical protein
MGWYLGWSRDEGHAVLKFKIPKNIYSKNIKYNQSNIIPAQQSSLKLTLTST